MLATTANIATVQASFVEKKAKLNVGGRGDDDCEAIGGKRPGLRYHTPKKHTQQRRERDHEQCEPVCLQPPLAKAAKPRKQIVILENLPEQHRAQSCPSSLLYRMRWAQSMISDEPRVSDT
jgi:hypothetical protein